jgi:hypothetical protein
MTSRGCPPASTSFTALLSPPPPLQYQIPVRVHAPAEIKILLAQMKQNVMNTEMDEQHIKSNMLQDIFVSLTGKRTKKNIVSNQAPPDADDETLAFSEEAKKLLVYDQMLDKIIELLSEFGKSPHVSIDLNRTSKKANEAREKAENQIRLVFAVLGQIIQEWYAIFCTDDQWQKWVQSILQTTQTVPLF